MYCTLHCIGFFFLLLSKVCYSIVLVIIAHLRILVCCLSLFPICSSFDDCIVAFPLFDWRHFSFFRDIFLIVFFVIAAGSKGIIVYMDRYVHEYIHYNTRDSLLFMFDAR